MITTADNQSAPQDIDTDLTAARKALARRLGSIINEMSDRNDVLLDMVWDRSETAEAAWFNPQMIRVTVNGSIALDDDTHPDDVDPLTISGRRHHPVIIGMTAHEAGHARSTRWNTWPNTTGRALMKAAVLLEEPRIEARHIQERPRDRVFLRAMARHILMPVQSNHTPVGNRWQAATATALILGRVAAGVLTREEAEPVREAAENVLGTSDLAALTNLLQETLELTDGDQDALLDIARRWVEVIGADEDQDLPGTGCAAGDPADTDNRPPHDPNTSDTLAILVTAVVEAASTAAQISTGALIDPEKEHRNERASARRAAHRKAESTARDDAQKSALRVFAPAPSAAGIPPRSPISGRRAPTAPERAAARRLGEALRKAQFREPTRLRVPSTLPPGQLSGRDAMLGAAQRSMGLPITARPFRTMVRKPHDNPPVFVGVAVDVSGSMDAYTRMIASTAWTFAHATRTVAGTSATVAFGSDVTPIVRPGQAPAKVTEFQANDGRHRFTEAARALDGALGLATRPGARLLVIVSDGHWEPAERQTGARAVHRLTEAGAHVLWFCLDPNSAVLPGAHRIDIAAVSEIPTALSTALIAALRTA
ncbi:VWA domain-containing protein [Streptomyces yaizuensis]|uniref:VWA domain-containing protein n=1 Tax=Streptomyces yaizuensis TaxID=2989713 RepID=A0ABQ5P639_9ACTN|nr:VWA domain-containing protein [Streptomyces sp. YSPA8]GLF98039.1 VWA domain-containing protein [Streptomyces sp. YSPA8]